MNRVQMAIMRAIRERMEKTMQSHRNQRAAQQNVQRPTTMQRPDGVDISMRAVQQDAKQHIKENFNADGTKRYVREEVSAEGAKRQAPAQIQGQEAGIAHNAQRIQSAERTSGQAQKPVQAKQNSLESVKQKQQDRGRDRER